MARAKVTASEFDSLDPVLQKEYGSPDSNGSRTLKVDSVDGLVLENVDGLKSALNTERANVSERDRRLKAFEGLDPEAARTAISKIEELGDNADISKKVDAAISAQRESWQKKYNETESQYQTRISNLEGQLQKVLVQDRLTQAIAKNEGDPELLMPHIAPRVRGKKLEDGTFAVEVLDANGNPDMNADATPKQLGQLVEEYRSNERFGFGFKGTGSAGSGADGGSGEGAPPKVGGVLQIKASDQDAVQANLDKISSGEAIIVDG